MLLISKKIKKAFTLIELLVSVLLFSFVIILASIVIFGSIRLNERMLSKKKVYEELNIVLDDMIREISQGSNYRYLPEIPKVLDYLNNISDPNMQNLFISSSGEGSGIVFKLSEYSNLFQNIPYNYPIPVVLYFIHDGRILKYSGGIQINDEKKVIASAIGDNNLGGTKSVLTSDNVIIKKFSVIVLNAESYSDNGNLGQPLVHIMLEGETKNYPKIKFVLGTSISQRESEN